MARDARDSRFRQHLEQKYLAGLPPRPLTAQEQADGLRFVQQFSPRYRNLSWHRTMAAAKGTFEAGYIPEDLFFVAIEPALNARDREVATSDKNGYSRLGLPLRLPQTLARVIRGRLVGHDYRPITIDEVTCLAEQCGATEVVLKPTMGTGGGRGVEFVAVEALPGRLTPLSMRRGAYDDWIVQRPVRQSAEMAALNPDSVNTLRIMTYRGTSGVVHLSTVLRIGRAGSRVDNQAGGGITCGVDEGGTLRPIAHQMYTPHEAHPDSGVRFAGYPAPAWHEAVAGCIASHEMIPAMDLISWDIAVDEQNRPTLIEFNTYQQGLQMHQMENGPLPAEVASEWGARARFWVVAGLVIRKPERD